MNSGTCSPDFPQPRRVVAVDARTLAQAGKGIPRFLAETLRELAGRENLKLILFSNRPLHPAHDLPFKTVIDTAWSLVPGSLWMMARLNQLAVRFGADTIWGPAHVLPRRHKDLHSVLTVHDLVHRIMPRSMGTWNRYISKWLVEPSILRADRTISWATPVSPSKQGRYRGSRQTRPFDSPPLPLDLRSCDLS